MTQRDRLRHQLDPESKTGAMSFQEVADLIFPAPLRIGRRPSKGLRHKNRVSGSIKAIREWTH